MGDAPGHSPRVVLTPLNGGGEEEEKEPFPPTVSQQDPIHPLPTSRTVPKALEGSGSLRGVRAPRKKRGNWWRPAMQ